MKTFIHPIIAFAGLIFFATGCAVDSIDADADDAPALSPQDIYTGTSGSNGLPPPYYVPRRYILDGLFQLPLSVNGALNPDPRFGAFIGAPGSEGYNVFQHAVGCALPTTSGVARFVGEGFMSGTSSWLSGPLNQQQRNDLHTCLFARMNPFGIQVPIWVGGPDTSQNVGTSNFPYFEALWSVQILIDPATGGQTTKTDIWPGDAILAHTNCKTPSAISYSFNSRICNHDPLLCSLNPRTDMATACTGTPGGGKWLCDGKPALETRVSQSGWNSLHPDCPIIF